MSTRAPYTAGQSVEVLATDFTTPGFPVVWMLATVTAVEPRDGGMWDVGVVTDSGIHQPQIIGKRGGNKKLRAC